MGLINGVYAKSFDDVAIIPTFVLTPLIYLGGIFYSIEMSEIPEQWKMISMFNPILYVVDFFRYAMLGQYQINPFLSFALISAFTLCFFAIAYYLLHKGIGIKE